MTQYFNFANLIRKYITNFTAIVKSDGYYNDSGIYVKGGESEYALQGAIISHRQNKIFRSEGTITEKDQALYMLNPLENALQGAEVVYKGNLYRIGEMLENAAITGVWYYNLKYVSAFDKAGGNND